MGESLTLTETAERFYARAVTLAADFEDLVASVERNAGKLEGHLRVMAPTTLMLQQLGPLLCAFLDEHPRITLARRSFG